MHIDSHARRVMVMEIFLGEVGVEGLLLVGDTGHEPLRKVSQLEWRSRMYQIWIRLEYHVFQSQFFLEEVHRFGPPWVLYDWVLRAVSPEHVQRRGMGTLKLFDLIFQGQEA